MVLGHTIYVLYAGVEECETVNSAKAKAKNLVWPVEERVKLKPTPNWKLHCKQTTCKNKYNNFLKKLSVTLNARIITLVAIFPNLCCAQPMVC
jgi:hypothetical protein